MPSHLLLCRELLDEIFKYYGVRSDFDDKDCAASLRAEWHTDLLNAAIAGPDLYEPALDVLWSHMHDTDPLFFVLGDFTRKLLPAKHKNGPRETSPILYIDGELTPERFARFRHHARRIVHLNVLNHSTFDVAVWENLARLNDHKPLLPRLRHCGWYVGVPFDHELMSSITPMLRSLDVRHRDELFSPSMTSGAKLRQKRAVGAREFLSDYMVLRLAESVPNLSRVRICTPRFECLFMLSRLSKLAHLTLSVKREFSLPGGDGKIKFPNLRRLDIVAPVNSIQALLEVIDCPSLSHIDLRPHGRCTVARLRTCLEYIAGTWSTSLVNLAVRGWQLWSGELRSRVPIPFVHGILPALSSLSSLRSLELAGSTLFWMHGFHVECLLTCLPGLRSLKITLLWEHPGDLVDLLILPPVAPDVKDLMALPAPSLSAVHAFSQLWLNLETLALPILDMLHIIEPAESGRVPPRGVGKFTYVRKRQAEDCSVYAAALFRLYEEPHVGEWLNVPDAVLQKQSQTTTSILHIGYNL